MENRMKSIFRKLFRIKNKNQSNRTPLPLAPFHTIKRKRGQRYVERPTPLTCGSIRPQIEQLDQSSDIDHPVPRTRLEKAYYAQRRTG